jgi:predicted DNA-binding transcriptional regulator AlpA
MKNNNPPISYEELPIILNVSDVQAILGISRVTAYELCRAEGFPAIRLSSRRIKISKKAFFEWLDRQSGAANAGGGQ